MTSITLDSRLAPVIETIDGCVYPNLAGMTNGIDIGEVFSRLHRLGLVAPSSHQHSPVAQMTEWAANTMAHASGRDITVTVTDRDTDRDYNIMHPACVPLTMTVSWPGADGVRNATVLNIDASRRSGRDPENTGILRLPEHSEWFQGQHNGGGCYDEWVRYLTDLTGLLDQLDRSNG